MKDYNYGGVDNWQNAQMSDDMEMGQSNSLYYNKQLRLGFIRKVYGVLSVQLLVTMVMCMFSIVSTSYAKFQIQNPAFVWISMIGAIIIMIALICFRSVSRTVPTNYILLFAFTFFEGYMVSCLCAVTSPKLVLMAAVMTCAITFALTVYACTTKTDFTVLNSLLFICSMVLLLFGLFCLFTQNKILHIIYCCLGVLIYSVYLIYDTQLIMGDKSRALEIDDYIYASLMLYLDIINLFIYILKLLKEN